MPTCCHRISLACENRLSSYRISRNAHISHLLSNSLTLPLFPNSLASKPREHCRASGKQRQRSPVDDNFRISLPRVLMSIFMTRELECNQAWISGQKNSSPAALANRSRTRKIHLEILRKHHRLAQTTVLIAPVTIINCRSSEKTNLIAAGEISVESILWQSFYSENTTS